MKELFLLALCFFLRLVRRQQIEIIHRVFGLGVEGHPTWKIALAAVGIIPCEFAVGLGEINRLGGGGVFEEPPDHLVGIDLNVLVNYLFILIISDGSSSGNVQIFVLAVVAVEIDVEDCKTVSV